MGGLLSTKNHLLVVVMSSILVYREINLQYSISKAGRSS